MSDTTLPHRKALLYLLLAALCWSTTGLFIKLVVHLNPFAVAGVRSACSAVLMACCFRPLGLDFSRQQLFAAACLALSMLLYIVSTQLTTATNALLLMYASPLYVVFFSGPVLREYPSKLDFCCVAVVLIGVLLLFADRLEVGHLWGNAVGLLGGMLFGGYAMMLRLQKDKAPIGATMLAHLLTAPAACLAVVHIPGVADSVPSSGDWLVLILLGVLGTGLPYALQARAIETVTALEAILLPIIEVPLLGLWVYLAIGERVGILGFIGSLTIVGATLLFGRQRVVQNATEENLPV